MLFSRAVTVRDKPLLTASFRRIIAEHVSPITLQSVEVSCALHVDSDPAFPDASPGNRLTGSAIVSSPYAKQFFLGQGGTVGADYVVSFVGTFSDGQKETIDVLVSLRTYAD